MFPAVRRHASDRSTTRCGGDGERSRRFPVDTRAEPWRDLRWGVADERFGLGICYTVLVNS
jgi:hypothetical protein